jgi:hypothetical protein
MQAGFETCNARRRSERPHFRAKGFDSPDSGEFAEMAEEDMPKRDNARFTLMPGIVNLVTTVYIRAKL